MYLKTYLETQNQIEFAKKLGISVRALSNYANGSRLTPLNIAFKIEELTYKKVRVNDLYKYWLEKNEKHSSIQRK